MQKRTKRLLLLLVSIAIFGGISYTNLETILSGPLSMGLNAGSISRVSEDGSGNRYIIFNSSKKITKIRPDERVEFIMKGDSRSEDAFYRAWDIANDDAGNLYVLDYVTDDSGLKIVRENIRMFDSSGAYLKTVFTRGYKEGEMPDMEGNFRKIRSVGGKIQYFYTGAD
ncbi:MAG TPA: hypothetical protein PKK43_13310, partial [Spirochaetota bacterium]|nr:hypothetical protein [Spirochaetota bacterium]